MAIQLESSLVWQTLEKELFAVLGLVTAKNEARTVGIVYKAHEQKVYIASGRETWKVRHVRNNPHVSLTVTLPKRIPLMPFIKIPAATITFRGTARVLEVSEVDAEVKASLLRGSDMESELVKNMVMIEVVPQGEFVTYGIGVSLMTMRHPDQSRGRAPVA